MTFWSWKQKLQTKVKWNVLDCNHAWNVWDLDSMKMIDNCMQTSNNSKIEVWKSRAGIHGLELIPTWRGRQMGRHRQTRGKRETWQLTNCFWSLWKSTTRDWFVWALALGRVKVDPDAMTGKNRTRYRWRKRGNSVCGKREDNWITGEQVAKRSAAQQLIGKDKAGVW